MKLIRANIQDAENLWKMQIAAFQDLYAKYQDPETSPATETLEKTMTRLEQPYTYYYYIKVEDCIVGAMRVIDHKEDGKYKFLSPIFIMNKITPEIMKTLNDKPSWLTSFNYENFYYL